MRIFETTTQPPADAAEERRARSLDTLRDLIVFRAGVDSIDDVETFTSADFDASDRQRLFPCVVHGKVVPTAERWDCPWCPADGTTAAEEGWCRIRVHAIVDRGTGMVPLNPS